MQPTISEMLLKPGELWQLQELKHKYIGVNKRNMKYEIKFHNLTTYDQYEPVSRLGMEYADIISGNRQEYPAT